MIKINRRKILSKLTRVYCYYTFDLKIWYRENILNHEFSKFPEKKNMGLFYHTAMRQKVKFRLSYDRPKFNKI